MNNLIKTLTFCILIVSAISLAFGQGLDMDCRSIQLPTQCRAMQAQIDAIEAEYDGEISAWQEDLRTASPSQKAQIIAQIRRLIRERASDQQLRRLKIDLATCRQQFDNIPRRPVAANILNASFVGNVVTNTTHTRAGGPFNNNLNLGLQFSRNRCNVTITSFPPITFQAPTPIGNIDVTISKIGGGSGNFFPVTGQMTMPLDFSFHYDTIFAGDDTARTTLTTGSTISSRGAFNLTGVRFTSTNNAPVDQCGARVGGTLINCTIRLVGTTVFQDGFLGGNEGSFNATGSIRVPQPAPPPPPQTRSECLANCQEIFLECMAERGRGRPTPAQCASGRNNCRSRCPRQ